jgi:phosphoglycolate phosphatase-like HAD superfamily hydrolase
MKRYRQEMKPNPYMLELAIDSIESRNPVLVGDSSSDIEAGQGAGIDSVYLNRSGKENNQADYNIQNLED